MTLTKALFISILFSCLAFLTVSAQERPYPSTLLWRITGNHLTKPSYLYGTMHITDRRIFYFGDSLYSCLEKAEGYAMEINPDSAVQALIQSIYNNDTSALVKDAVSSKEFSKLSKRMETELGVPADKVTKKQLWLYSFKSHAKKKDDDMDAPVDTYLYNIAKHQGKWVGGIEDVKDQLNLMEELGSKFDADALLYNAEGNSGLERMTTIYKDQDLNKINAWIVDTDSTFRDNLLDHRNKKMAYRIDSMAAVRSNFFAVGAAHLPGKQGLLALLKARGFTLEPIISSRKIAPEAYTYASVELPWLTVQDDEKSYTVQMPGKAFPVKVPNSDASMQCYVDLGTGLSYFAMTVQYPIKTGNTDSMLSTVARNIAHSGVVEKKESITSQGVHGIELITNKAGYFYRVRTYLKDETLYMVMTGAEKETVLASKDGNRFLNSLVMNELPKAPAPAHTGWATFALPEKGVTMDLPGKPGPNKQMEQLFRKNAGMANWKFVCYSYSDAGTGNYYLVSVRETLSGYFLSNDTVVFSEAKQNTINQGSTILAFETITRQGYPAMRLDALYGQTSLVLNSFTLCRANRVYTIMALSEKGKGDTADIHRFLNSFRLTDNLPASWSDRPSPDGSFHAWVPAPLTKKAITGASDDSTNISIGAYDSLSSVSYHIYKAPLSPYYWTGSDSSFNATQLKQLMGYQDSLLSQKAIENGGIKGLEYVIIHPVSNNVKRIRLLVSGDSIYRVFSYLPRQLLTDADVDRFFSSFRLTHERYDKPWLQDKTPLLLAALSSTDSTTYAHAKEALEEAAFTKTDLPLLYEALLHTYKDSSEAYYTTYGRLMRAVAKIQDTSGNSFVAAHYFLLGEEKEKLKYPLLSLLVETKTQSSYNLLKQLLLQQTPREGDAGLLEYSIKDSLQLTATLFPDLLPLSRDSLLVQLFPSVLMSLVDSNLLSPATLLPYKKDYYSLARKELKKMPGEANVYKEESLIRLLALFKDTDATALLQQFVRAKQLYIKKAAALALIKSNRAVDPLQLEKIAADKGMRTDLYDELVKCGKKQLFPVKYYTQKSFAGSELYQQASADDYDSVNTVFIGERKALFMGKLKTFYLFNVSMGFTENKEPMTHRLGITGPYTPGSTHIVTTSEASYINWTDEYDPAELDTQFKALLKKSEEMVKKQKDDD